MSRGSKATRARNSARWAQIVESSMALGMTRGDAVRAAFMVLWGKPLMQVVFFHAGKEKFVVTVKLKALRIGDPAVWRMQSLATGSTSYVLKERPSETEVIQR